MLKAILAFSLVFIGGPALWALKPAAQLGEGAQRLTVGAVKIARRQWNPDACLGGIDVDIHAGVASDPPGPSRVFYNEFRYSFHLPGEGGLDNDKFRVSMVEADGSPLRSSSVALSYGVYESRFQRGKDYTERYPFDGTCVMEMSVDSGEALLRAMRGGLISDPRAKYHAILRTAQNGKGKYYTDPRLFGRSFWIVGEFGGSLNYYIDAKTGALLLKLKP